MIKTMLTLLKETKLETESIKAAKGRYKLPENWREFKRYLKYKFNG